MLLVVLSELARILPHVSQILKDRVKKADLRGIPLEDVDDLPAGFVAYRLAGPVVFRQAGGIGAFGLEEDVKLLDNTILSASRRRRVGTYLRCHVDDLCSRESSVGGQSARLGDLPLKSLTTSSKDLTILTGTTGSERNARYQQR